MSDNLPDIMRGPAPVMPARNIALVDDLDHALMFVSERLPELVGHPDVQAIIHQRLDLLRRNIATLQDELERLLLDEMPVRENRAGRMVHERLVIDGVAVVEPADKGGRWTDIDYHRLLTDLVRQWHMTGEMDVPTDIVPLLLEVLQMSGIRSNAKLNTGLHRWGHDRGEYGTYVAGTEGVRIIPTQGELRP